MMRRFWNARHTVPLLVLVILTLLYWANVLFTGQVLLPGAMLAGFAPFGGHSNASWNILQWDALAQYYPWRLYAARMLHQGLIPLWNPYQFSGTPFVANLQSAVFYPLNLPFWVFNVASAFAVSAALHTLLAAVGTYFLAQRWKLTRGASLLAAVGFAFCGYLAAWFVLPTLADTACWLPLLLLLLELTVEAPPEKRWQRLALFSLALACTVLAGHVQIFLYIVAALILRALFLPRPFRALGWLLLAGAWSFGLAALQILPTLELARLGHRAGGPATADVWQQFIMPRALQWSDLPSLFIPQWPVLSFNENFAYVGVALCLLAVAGIGVAIKRRSRQGAFVAVLAIFGLLYALATPLAEGIFLYVPGVAQMGGPGRALLLWSFGASMLAAFALDWLIRRENAKSPLGQRNKSALMLTAVALLIVSGELFWNGQTAHPTSPASSIYPATALTDWLQQHVPKEERVLFVTPRGSWLPREVLQQNGRNHPAGVLPPNGAMVYGLRDVSGYDSLSPKIYRDFLIRREGADVSPPLNGNMILLNNINSHALNTLSVGFVVMEANGLPPKTSPKKLQQVWQGDGCVVYRRVIDEKYLPRDGRDFYPGWRRGVYEPASFRFGLFISLCAWFAAAMTVGICWGHKKR